MSEVKCYEGLEKSNAKVIRNSNTSNLLEYLIILNDKDIDFCVNTINGRYRKKGYCTNEKCKEICYVLQGKGQHQNLGKKSKLYLG